MKTKEVLSAIAIGAALSGCGAQSAAQPRDAFLGGHESRVVELPERSAGGEAREVRVLVDEPGLKLATITLRGGTALPTHRSPVPVTITALAGSGAVVVGEERLRLDAAHAVVLAPNVAHAVEPDSESELVLLVHHLGSREETQR